LLRGNLGALRWLVSPLGIVLFAVVALPWFLLVSRRNPEFVDFFVIKQHVERFLRPAEHQQPLWFFVPMLGGGLLALWLFAVCGGRLPWRCVARLAVLRVSPAALYCVVWSAVVFVFFSLSGSKLATYVLPLFSPLAILGARFFHQLIRQERTAVLR